MELGCGQRGKRKEKQKGGAQRGTDRRATVSRAEHLRNLNVAEGVSRGRPREE